jgi:hypothetical protein
MIEHGLFNHLYFEMLVRQGILDDAHDLRILIRAATCSSDAGRSGGTAQRCGKQQQQQPYVHFAPFVFGIFEHAQPQLSERRMVAERLLEAIHRQESEAAVVAVVAAHALAESTASSSSTAAASSARRCPLARDDARCRRAEADEVGAGEVVAQGVQRGHHRFLLRLLAARCGAVELHAAHLDNEVDDRAQLVSAGRGQFGQQLLHD